MNAEIAPIADVGALPDWIAPGRAALLVIDMQVDFASPEGALGQVGVDLSSVPAALLAAERLADAAREAGVPVIFVGLETMPVLDSPAWREWMIRRGGTGDGALCRLGTPGAEFVGPVPEPEELVIGKIRYSGFFRTALDAGLKALGVDTLVVAGLTTECCIDCTVRDAFHLDYHVFIATDACAAYDPALHEGALKALELNCAILATTDDILDAWLGEG